MKSVYDALKARWAELPGYMAPREEVTALERYLVDPALEWICRVYRDFPVYGMMMSFQVNDEGRPRFPGRDFEAAYDSTRDHSVTWMMACHVLYQLCDSPCGAAVFSTGYLPIGSCAFGGDGYFVPYRPVVGPPVPLYQIYYDWVDLTRKPALCGEGIRVVSPYFEEVIRVARLARAFKTPFEPWPVKPSLP